jgi:heat shock protein HslJ
VLSRRVRWRRGWGASEHVGGPGPGVPVPVNQPSPFPTAVTSPDSDPGGSGALAGASWVLESLAVDGTRVPPAAGWATLTFASGGGGGGSTGCTRYRLAWQQDRAALMLTVDVRPTASGDCDSPSAAAQEAMLRDLLPQVAHTDQSDRTLLFLDADGSTLLRYRAALTDLAGTTWSATGLVALTGDTPPGAVDIGGPVSAITAAFAEEGTVSGFTGCREYIGLWDSDPATRALAVTGFMTQGQDCTDQAATIETRYLRTLGAVGGSLIRFTSAGSEG